MKNNLLNPEKGIFRSIFLYVGQGESTLLIVPNGDNHEYILVDFNYNKDNGGEDIVKFLTSIGKDKVIFINTHPHNDHTRGLGDIKDVIKEVWHSGHKPSKKHEASFKELNEVMKKVGEANVYYLRGSNDLNTLHTNQEEESKAVHKIGDVDFQVFAPAKYVCDEVDDETPEQRRKRIHEQCGVVKVTYKDKSVLITGDSDKTAWKDFITQYHKENLQSEILSASHHGSRTFFKEGEDDQDIYEDHIKIIEPEHLIISAPKQKDSPHGHPHDDAMELYKKYIKSENIHHLGENGENVVVDIDSDGNISVLSEDNFTDNSRNDEGDNLIYETSGKSTRPYCQLC
jgi:beta-lactamase superfamily II metal-dependent hydrolase